jgi:O-antigen/teichoic acid export membrane protein
VTQGPPPSLTHRTVKGMAWTAYGSGAMALLRILVLVVLTRLLSPADFGLVGAALVVITFSLAFSQMGLGPALVQRPALEPGHISTAFFASTGFGFLVALVVWLIAPLLAMFFRMENLTPVVRWLAIVFPISGLTVVAENLLLRDLRFRLLANTDVIAYAVGYGVVGVTLALLGRGVWALVAAQATQVCVRNIILLRAKPPLFHPRPSRRCFRELLGFGAGISAARAGFTVANQVDNFVVGRWQGAVALGLYSRAFQLMAVPTALLGDVLDRVLFPTMARVQDDSRRLSSAYLQGTAIIALVTLPASVVSAILAPELVAVAFGPKWTALVPVFQVLALGMLFRTSFRLSDSLSRATGRVYRRAWRHGVFAILVFLGALIGQRFGVTGVAYGVLVALFLIYLLMAQLALHVGQVSWLRYLGAQVPAMRLTLVTGAVTLGVSMGLHHLGVPSILRLAAGAITALGTIALLVWLAPNFALGEYGVRMLGTLRVQAMARLRPTSAGEPA